MTRLFYLAAGVLVGGAAVVTSLKYHVLRTHEGFTMVPKQSTTLDETYIDIRQFGISDWLEHRGLATAIVEAKKEHLMQNSVANSWKGQVDRLLQGAQQK